DNTAPQRPRFSPADCDFALFTQSKCEAIPYSPDACRAHAWFGAQPPSTKICLGFQKPKPGSTCADNPHNIDCFLEKQPNACNFLQSSEWSSCLNELYLQCLEHGDLGDGHPIWTTPSSEMPRPYAKFVTASEMCHWYRAKREWP